MRTFIFPLVLLTAACQQDQTEAGQKAQATSGTTEVFASGPGDRLCLKPGDGQVGIITYAAAGGSNCSVRGRIAEPGLIRPNGDEACEITYARTGNTIALKEVGKSCAFYCGPGASLAGKTFARMDNGGGAVDLAGDPLC
jgi:hypothetical protein